MTISSVIAFRLKAAPVENIMRKFLRVDVSSESFLCTLPNPYEKDWPELFSILKLCNLLLKYMYKIPKKRSTMYICCSTLFSHETKLKTFVLHCTRSGELKGLHVHLEKVFWCIVWISHTGYLWSTACSWITTYIFIFLDLLDILIWQVAQFKKS